MNSFIKKVSISLLLITGMFLGSIELCRPGKVLSTTEYAHLLAILFNINFNSVEVVADKHIDLKKIKILWSSEVGEQNVVIFNGRLVAKPGHAYGPNKFLVYYSGKLLKEVEHFKQANWDSYDYTFNFNTLDGVYLVALSIRGLGFNE